MVSNMAEVTKSDAVVTVSADLLHRQITTMPAEEVVAASTSIDVILATMVGTRHG